RLRPAASRTNRILDSGPQEGFNKPKTITGNQVPLHTSSPRESGNLTNIIMKKHTLYLLGLLAGMAAGAAAVCSAFIYQGQLSSNGVPVAGFYDFRFRLAVDPLASSYVGSSISTNGVLVTNGMFTATIDFGAGIFSGSNFWLEIAVRTNG